MEFTKALKEEHRLIERILAALTSSAKQQLHECDDYDAAGKFDPKLFRQGMDLIMDFGIKCHMKKEDILISEINGRAEKDMAIVEHLLEEHNYIGMFVNSISRAIDVLSMGGSDDEEKRKRKLETLQNFTEYSELVRHHMSMVDCKLFPMCEKAFSDKEKKVLLEKFKEVDGACNRAKLGKTSSEVKKLEKQTKTHLFPEKPNPQIWHHLHKNSKTSIGS